MQPSLIVEPVWGTHKQGVPCGESHAVDHGCVGTQISRQRILFPKYHTRTFTSSSALSFDTDPMLLYHLMINSILGRALSRPTSRECFLASSPTLGFLRVALCPPTTLPCLSVLFPPELMLQHVVRPSNNSPRSSDGHPLAK